MKANGNSQPMSSQSVAKRATSTAAVNETGSAETLQTQVGAPTKRQNHSAVRASSRKPTAVQSEIIARRVSGQNKSEIARGLGVARNTVTSVLELNNVEQMFEDGRLGALKRVPQALKTLDVRLEKNSESAAIWLLDKCFDNQQPTGKRMAGDVTLNQTLQVLLRPETPESDKLKSPVISEMEVKSK